jgi:predicted nucleic acid-binding protein
MPASSGLLDTSVFIATEQARSLGPAPLQAAVSVVTIGELHLAVLSATDSLTRSRRADTLLAVRTMDPVPVSEWVMDEWARLVSACRRAGVTATVKRLDSVIAATAISLGVPVVTQDDDFDQMAIAYPALEVVRV